MACLGVFTGRWYAFSSSLHFNLLISLTSLYTQLKRRKMSFPVGDSPSDLPCFHYMSERDRLSRHSAIKRTTVLASLPERCPYRARSSPKNSKKLELGWLEFHSPEPPDPEVARPGDVWIQIPLDFDPTARSPDADAASLCRLFVCYSAEGRQWTEWEGDERIHTNDPSVGVHPLASPAMWGGTTERDAQFYLAFTGSDFTWVKGTRLAVIAGQWRLGRLHGDWMKRLIAQHSIDGIPFLPPFEAIAAWAERKTLTASGIQVKKKDAKRVFNEPTPELPSIKRRKPENETSSPGVVAKDWRPALAPEPETKSYPRSFVSWSTVPHWTVMQPTFPRPSTPPSSDASDKPLDSSRTPPSSNFVLRPATFALSPSPANDSLPSDNPPPTPPSPVPQLQLPQTEGRPPPTMYPHVSFTPTLSPPRYGERSRKRVIPITCAQPASVGPSASAPASSSVELSTTSAMITNTVSAPLVSNGRRAPAGAMDVAPGVRGKYAKAGAVQHGWSLYVGARLSLCWVCLVNGADVYKRIRRRNFSCPFLATSVNGLVRFAPVSRASGVGVVVLSESPVRIMHSLDRQGPNRILHLGQDLLFLCRVPLLLRWRLRGALKRRGMKSRIDGQEVRL